MTVVSARLRVGTAYGFREDADAPVRRHEGPGADVVVVLSFGNEWTIDGVRHTSFVGGLHERQVVTEHPGSSFGMQLNLPPPTAYGLFRLPLYTLARRTVALEDVLGRGAEQLVERLVEAPDWNARFALLDDAFAEPPSPSREVVHAYARLRATHGRVRVRALADELGWSRTRLAARFREQVGVPPKTVARVLRFERALELARRGGRSWGEIAYECGYYDQSHLVNEFRAMAGRTPTGVFPRRAA
jgi:AraC-like DNA-binding protein